ncbi:MAG: FG-GAP repeat protein, partial [Gemmatimonadetes bacterium]|nr:FG-GAP repeat protein [Gemmatimonadota bacterium]
MHSMSESLDPAACSPRAPTIAVRGAGRPVAAPAPGRERRSGHDRLFTGAYLIGAATIACGLLAVPALPVEGQAPQQGTVAQWDASLFSQPGQRSLFLRTPNGGNFGLPLGAADVNGDGRDDALLCAFAAAEAFLFLSPPQIAGIREGVATPGEVTRIAGVPSLGVECSAGDVNGDGFADLVLGAPAVAVGGQPGAGAVYVVFGSPSPPAQVDVTSRSQALEIGGAEAGDHFGVWVDALDVDGDGIEDILIGAPDADGPANARQNAGEAHVVYGGADLAPGATRILTLEAAGRVFTVLGAEAGDKAGSALDAGRIDGGPVAELVVGSALNRAAQAVFGGASDAADGPDGSRPEAGEVAIVFDPARGRTLDLAAPSADVAVIYGADARDFAGEEVDVGDADGDGFGDVLVGALTGNGFANLRGEFAGEAYLVYGGPGLRGQRIDLRTPPPGVTAFFGPSAGGITGDTARFIDIDGDGRAEVFIGSPTGTFRGPDGRERTGALFFVRSPAGRLPSIIDFDDPTAVSVPLGFVLAADPGDILSYSLVRADADGDSVDDVLVNGMTGWGLNNAFPSAGEAYVIDGQTLAASLRPFASADVTGDANVDVRDLQAVASALVGRRDLSAEEQRSA